jgi:hypothetical protein
LAEQLVDGFVKDVEPNAKQREAYGRVSYQQVVSPDYETNDKFQPYKGTDPAQVHTTHEMVHALENNPDTDIDARILKYSKNKESYELVKLNKEQFLKTFREGSSQDSFASDSGGSSANSGLIGDDFTPILGGPFHKTLYIYDYLKMNAACFYAYHHDPMARRIVHTIRDFTLGRGYRIDFKNEDHQAYWDAFEEVNNFPELMEYVAIELSLYGETMLWWLPDSQTEIVYRRSPGEAVKKGFIPRIRVIDPSMIWEIITWPEDITSVIAYQWVSPTQYQIYTHDDLNNKSIPSQKFIYQQLPAKDVIHVKINSVSNEKRGRSDLFPVLGYLKRLRDTINYTVLSTQKNAAWSIDTTIQGSQTDIDAYFADQQAMGTVPPAGSEFIHTDKIKREYLANSGGARAGGHNAFELCLSMIAAGSGIPASYFGTHLSGGQTRASAIVSTEPVAKLFEMRQLKYERIMCKVIDQYFKKMGITDQEYEITFPEVITQDRSQKLKDLALAEAQMWISPERAANIASKELQVSEYDWEEEIKTIKAQADIDPFTAAPLTMPGIAPKAGLDSKTNPSDSAVTGQDKVAIKGDYGN